MEKLFRNAQDPVSCGTHALGALLALLGGFFMLVRGAEAGSSARAVASAMCFCLSMIALYSASAIYHFYPGNTSSTGVKKVLRKVDHSMIYVLIAGSYTPFSLMMLPPQKGTIFCAVLWGIAIIGILAKILWINAPRVLTTSLYLAMGWSILFVIRDFDITHPGCLFLVALGGIFYSIGAVFYALKRPNPSASFGFHEVFHVFILLGSFSHYLAVFLFVL